MMQKSSDDSWVTWLVLRTKASKPSKVKDGCTSKCLLLVKLKASTRLTPTSLSRSSKSTADSATNLQSWVPTCSTSWREWPRIRSEPQEQRDIVKIGLLWPFDNSCILPIHVYRLLTININNPKVDFGRPFLFDFLLNVIPIIFSLYELNYEMNNIHNHFEFILI